MALFYVEKEELEKTFPDIENIISKEIKEYNRVTKKMLALTLWNMLFIMAP